MATRTAITASHLRLWDVLHRLCSHAAPATTLRYPRDLNPVDVNDEDQVAWLETLVWPEEADRLTNLRAALAIAKERRPLVVRGDLRTDLPALAEQAPEDATLVIFHSAVLAYLERPDRLRFRESLRGMPATWISNEAPEIVSEIVEQPPLVQPFGSFPLTVNGQPTACTDSHGPLYRMDSVTPVANSGRRPRLERWVRLRPSSPERWAEEGCWQ